MSTPTPPIHLFVNPFSVPYRYPDNLGPICQFGITSPPWFIITILFYFIKLSNSLSLPRGKHIESTLQLFIGKLCPNMYYLVPSRFEQVLPSNDSPFLEIFSLQNLSAALTYRQPSTFASKSQMYAGSVNSSLLCIFWVYCQESFTHRWCLKWWHE